MPNATEEALTGLRKRDLVRFLENDPRVREWLSGGNPDDVDSGALMSTKDAAELLKVERPRVWRLEQRGRLLRIDTTRATPLYMRHEVVALAAELEAERERAAGRERDRTTAAAP